MVKEHEIIFKNLCDCDIDFSSTFPKFNESYDLYFKFITKYRQLIRLDNLVKALNNLDTYEFYYTLTEIIGVSGNLGITTVYDAAKAMLVEYKSTGLTNTTKMEGLIKEIEEAFKKIDTAFEH